MKLEAKIFLGTLALAIIISIVTAAIYLYNYSGSQQIVQTNENVPVKSTTTTVSSTTSTNDHQTSLDINNTSEHTAEYTECMKINNNPEICRKR